MRGRWDTYSWHQPEIDFLEEFGVLDIGDRSHIRGSDSFQRKGSLISEFGFHLHGFDVLDNMVRNMRFRFRSRHFGLQSSGT